MLEMFYGITIFISYLLYTEGQNYHEFGMIESCTGSAGGNEKLFTYEDEVAAYMDLEKKKIVMEPNVILLAPVPELLIFTTDEDPSAGLTRLCEDTYFRTLSFHVPEPLEPPLTSLYPRNDVKLNVRNTLICLVSGFYPPPVRVSWTKNNVNVTDESTLSRYHPNKDRTLNVFSRLSFIPDEGDIYSCSVEHKALQQPQTRTWDVEINEPSIGPTVFCGVGLALGLLGLATGVFFFAKGKKWI
ncbi:H-2 class II histocompatibility antigen, A-Q alpha chain-like [Labeo rohita]|nr:H-2 class II histocompatibility antigen, A-Q alpha chain-like [Labeo rohita]